MFRPFLCSLLFVGCLTGCGVQVARLPFATTQPGPLPDINHLTHGQHVTSDVYAPVVIVPINGPSIQEALTKAIEVDRCAVGLTDVTITQYNWVAGLGVQSYHLEGNLLIDGSKPGCI